VSALIWIISAPIFAVPHVCYDNVDSRATRAHTQVCPCIYPDDPPYAIIPHYKVNITALILKEIFFHAISLRAAFYYILYSCARRM
jgi:hypothetical protein